MRYMAYVLPRTYTVFTVVPAAPAVAVLFGDGWARPSANVSREAERNGDGTGSSGPRATAAAGGPSGAQAGPGPDRLARRLADLPRGVHRLPRAGARDPDLPAVHRLDVWHRRQQQGLRADLPRAVLRRGAGSDGRPPGLVGLPGAQ